MAKISTRLTTFIAIVTVLTILTTVSSCVTPMSSHPDGRQMVVVRHIFPSATDITEIPFFISQDAHISGRPDYTTISEIKGDQGLLGYCVESKVMSRSGPFKIRVLLDPQLYVKQATVISYPWNRGRDIGKRAFTSQFEGKGPEDPIQLDKDIDAMTGATISSRAMSEGVRDAIKLLKLINEK